MSMFCYQCQETAMGTGCTLKGVCGKTSEVANLQDLLLFVVRGIAVYNEHLRKNGHPSEQADKFIYDALFITITNANFDKVAITEKIKEGLKLKNELANKVKVENAPDECLWNGSEDEFEIKNCRCASHSQRGYPLTERTCTLWPERNGRLRRACA